MIESLQFRGSAVLVTGAAAGIGFSCCEVLADLGAKIIAVDKNPNEIVAYQSQGTMFSMTSFTVRTRHILGNTWSKKNSRCSVKPWQPSLTTVT